MRLILFILSVSLVSFLLTGCGGPATRTVTRPPDAFTRPSGLVIQEFKIGEGAALDRGNAITIKYATYLADGTKVENSDAYAFIDGFGEVIEGWDEGVAGMRVGGQRKLIIPPSLAYGETGRDGIPPNAAIITYIELLSVALPPNAIAQPSGLIIQDFKVGENAALDRGNVVTITYATYLQDGTKVDSSDGYTFVGGVGRVIRGWDEGLADMRIGGQRKLTIPPSLTYLETGQYPGIPPGATIITCMEVLSVAPQQTTNGVKYVDLVEGTGSSPASGDTVKVDYTGWLASDGTKFDSSLDEGKSPIEFAISGGKVIKGFDEGVRSMQVGGKRIVVIPPELGYGSQGSGSIPPNATLLFEMELLEIKPPP